jgi:ParB/RepB/Spo0J family partition protein
MNKQEFKIISIASISESKTNPRGRDFSGSEFNDLVASVKEKGILVPVIVRPSDGGYEIVAGSRRLAAVKKLQLKTIPASIQKLSDGEAREVQIIENLQRVDVHPLEEGEAYRQLIEFAKITIPDLAVKVGKNEAYVKQRLFLTNLIEPAAALYRSGKITGDGAVHIARLSAENQRKVLAWAKDDWNDGERYKASEIRDYIKEEITSRLDYQPWLKDPAAMKAVGPCGKSCTPAAGALFDDVKPGACTSLEDWNRKMTKFVEWRAEQDKLVKVSKGYGRPVAGVLPPSAFETLGMKPKEHCKFAQQAIVADGEDRGTTIWICADPACAKHKGEHSEYRQTPEERKKRKAEIARERTIVANKYAAFTTGIKKSVKWPLTDRVLDALIEDVLREERASTMGQIAARLNLRLQPERRAGAA